jgi:glycosyltransferase involved in cell wall biosynthesis
VRVVHCIYDDPQNPWVGGGGAVRVLELYRHLKDRVEATVLVGAYPGSTDETRDGVRYRHLGRPLPYAWSRITYAHEATRLLREMPFEAAVFDFSAYTPILVPRERPVGITVHHVTGPTARERWGRLPGAALAELERRMLRRARVFSATSGASHEALRKIVPEDATICSVGAGVDDALFHLQRAEQGYVLYFGRLDWFQKGLDVLLAAFARLAAERPGLELKLAGRGRDADRVRRRARDLGIETRVSVLGGVSDEERLRLLSGALLLMMPSRFEGFGMVAAEAMAAGVPVVAAASGSLPEVVAAPAGGVLVPPADPDALAEAAARLLDNDLHRVKLSHSARVSAERFRWRVVAERHFAFLKEIAAHGPVPDGGYR